MQIRLKKTFGNRAFTIAEVVICFAIMALVIGGMLTAYTNSSVFAERAGYAMAAQAQAVQVMERVRAATWDTMAVPPVDTTTNLPLLTTNLLELPISGTNAIYATNTLVISNLTVDTSPPCYVKMVQVTTTWPWKGTVCSNVMIAYRAPDQ